MKQEEPRFIELVIDGKYILRFNRTWDRSKWAYVYSCAGTKEEIERLQADIHSVFPPYTTKS